jgi:hypothetical protein
MIATPASLRSDFIHIVGMAIYIAPESTNHITGIRIRQGLYKRTWRVVMRSVRVKGLTQAR